MGEIVSVEGPVELVTGQLTLRIPLSAVALRWHRLLGALDRSRAIFFVS